MALAHEGKSVPNIGSRGRTTASLRGRKRSKKIDVSLGSATLEDMEPGCPLGSGFTSTAKDSLPTMFLAAVAEDVKLEGALFTPKHVRSVSLRPSQKAASDWVALLPFRDPEDAGKGDAPGKRARRFGYFTMGMVWSGTLAIRRSFPIYEEAADLTSPFACI